jgi:hypothetical protein
MKGANIARLLGLCDAYFVDVSINTHARELYDKPYSVKGVCEVQKSMELICQNKRYTYEDHQDHRYSQSFLEDIPEEKAPPAVLHV